MISHNLVRGFQKLIFKSKFSNLELFSVFFVIVWAGETHSALPVLAIPVVFFVNERVCKCLGI